MAKEKNRKLCGQIVVKQLSRLIRLFIKKACAFERKYTAGIVPVHVCVCVCVCARVRRGGQRNSRSREKRWVGADNHLKVKSTAALCRS